MKNLLSLLCLLLVGGGAFAADPYLTDVQVKDYQNKANKAMTEQRYVFAAACEAHILLGTTTEDISTFDKAKVLVEPIIQKYSKIAPSKSSSIRNYVYHQSCNILYYWYNNRDRSIFNALIEQGVYGGVVIEFCRSEKSPLTAEEKYNTLYKYLTLKDLTPSVITVRAADAFIAHCAYVDEAKAKKDLKTINRVISPRLISDKEKWEPIVAKIRTALETY